MLYLSEKDKIHECKHQEKNEEGHDKTVLLENSKKMIENESEKPIVIYDSVSYV